MPFNLYICLLQTLVLYSRLLHRNLLHILDYFYKIVSYNLLTIFVSVPQKSELKLQKDENLQAQAKVKHEENDNPITSIFDLPQ